MRQNFLRADLFKFFEETGFRSSIFLIIRSIFRCIFLLFLWFPAQVKEIPAWWIAVLLRPSENKRLEINYIRTNCYFIFCFLIKIQCHCLGAGGLAAFWTRALQSAPGALTLCWGFPRELDQHRLEQLQLPTESLTSFAHLVWEDLMAPSPTAICTVHTLKPVYLYMKLGDFCQLRGSRTGPLVGCFLIVKALPPLDNLE